MLFEPKVTLRESDHRYFDKDGNNYLSFSSLYSFVVDDFDAKKIAYFAGGKNEEGMIAKLDEWDAKRAEGTRIDKALDKYAKDGCVIEEDKDIEQAVKAILAGYGKNCYEQMVVYCADYMVAGTLDKLSLTSNRKDSKFIVSDFKCFEDFNITEYRKWLRPPFDHLPASKFTKISFQLSFYAYLLEKLTGKKCGGLFIHLIDPTTCKNGGEIKQEKVWVPYLKNDIIVFLETFKDQIKLKLNNKGEFVI